MGEVSQQDRRRQPRVVPQQPVTAAMESEGGSITYGFVADISEGGACVRADPGFGVGDLVVVRLGFTQPAQPVPATGRVVWKANGGGNALRYGIEWTHVGPQRDRLGLLIRRLA